MDEQSIFQEALELRDPDRRAAYLENACRDNSQVRQRIDRLLNVYQRVDGFHHARSSAGGACSVASLPNSPTAPSGLGNTRT